MSAPPQPSYLVVLRHVLVAQDIAQAIAEWDPAAAVAGRVLVAREPMEALDRLDGVARLAVAFVAAPPAAFRGSVLAALIAARDGRVVLMGEEAELAPDGYPVLARPFRTGDVHALLARLRRP
jgi:hypothetical protein